MSECPQSLAVGAEAIRAALAVIPESAGVYRMLNAAGEPVYIGKAKHLRARVGSYVSTSRLTARLMRMVAQVARVEWTVTRSEAEALLLEANLIKKHRPRYNILLKDDKSFPYLMFSAHAFPRIAKHRGAAPKGAELFGPFASVGALNATLALLQRVFLLRPCADTVFKNRSRPCLQYQIKRCSAPCVGYVGEAEYEAQLGLARAFLKGKNRVVQEALTQEMEAASAALQFERAAALRDRIQALTQVQQEQGLRTAGLHDADLFALWRRGGRAAVAVFSYREGLHLGSQCFHPADDGEADDGALMEAFLAQYYVSRLPPRELLVSVMPPDPTLMAEALALSAGHAVELRQPERGDKKALLEHALTEAQAAGERASAEAVSTGKHLAALAELFGLPEPPERVEVYDNSHISGTDQLGAMIVATPEGFKKSAYRIFNRQSAETIAGDDLSMMREVMRRRFRGGARGGGEEWPALLLIDGGPTQLSVVREVLAESGLSHLPTVAIAKGEDRNAGREWFYIEGRAPFQLPINDPTLHYLQRLRDEAHRFAIGAHRKRRSARVSASALDDIPGIGPARKKALLQHFGSRSGVEGATLAELQKVPGFSERLAAHVYGYFHG